MFPLKRFVSAIVVLTMAPQLTGCIVHTTRPVPPAELRSRATPRLVGVTTTTGLALRFDTLPSPRLVGDTVLASVRAAEYHIARSAIFKMWMARPGEPAGEFATSDLRQATARASEFNGHIVGLTTAAGVAVQFDDSAPVTIAHDSLYATARGAPYAVALNEVRFVSVSRTDVGRSVLKSSVVAAGVTLGLVAVAVVGWIVDPPRIP